MEHLQDGANQIRRVNKMVLEDLQDQILTEGFKGDPSLKTNQAINKRIAAWLEQCRERDMMNYDHAAQKEKEHPDPTPI